MLSIKVPNEPYLDPWNIPLQNRLECLASGKYRIAYFYEEANNSTFRYRAYNMVQVLQSIGNSAVSASYFFLKDLHQINVIVDNADVLVVCRSGYNMYINLLISKFKVKKKRVLFDVDDLVFDTSYVNLIINALGQDANKAEVWDYWFAYTGRMGETLRMCDGAITTNKYLAKKIYFCSPLLQPISLHNCLVSKKQHNPKST